MNECNTRKLADKIARILEAESRPADLATLYAGLDKINHRLDKLEHTLANGRPQVAEPTAVHPSVERFAIAEAIVDELFSDHKKEKACTFEPNGKPCDHCAMCSSRGF